METANTTAYYVLCERGSEASELTSDGQVMIFATKRAASLEAARMRLLMEGGQRVTYTIKKAR